MSQDMNPESEQNRPAPAGETRQGESAKSAVPPASDEPQQAEGAPADSEAGAPGSSQDSDVARGGADD